jgi:hypothetical protein
VKTGGDYQLISGKVETLAVGSKNVVTARILRRKEVRRTTGCSGFLGTAQGTVVYGV